MSNDIRFDGRVAIVTGAGGGKDWIVKQQQLWI